MTINRTTWETTKDTPGPKTKKKQQWDGRRSTTTVKSNPIPAGWVTHKLENNNTKKFWRCCEGSESQSSRPGNSKQGLWILRESDLEQQWDLIIGLSEEWEKKTPVLKATSKILHASRLRGKEQCTHRRLNQNYLLFWRASCGGLGQQGLPEGRGHREHQARKAPLGMNPLGVPNPTQSGSPWAKQLPGRECDSPHQQITELRFYWARPCPQEQKIAFPLASPSHQQAYTSFLASFIRRQTEAAAQSERLKQNPYSRKVNHDEKAESYVPDEATR